MRFAMTLQAASAGWALIHASQQTATCMPDATATTAGMPAVGTGACHKRKAKD